MDAEQRAPGTPQWMAEVLRGAASQIEILGKVSYVDHLRQIAAYMESRALTQSQPGWRGTDDARDAARWRELVAETDATPCKYPCLRDDLGDYCRDKGFGPWDAAPAPQQGEG